MSECGKEMLKNDTNSFCRQGIMAQLLPFLSDGFCYPLGIENNITNYISNGYYVQANYALRQFFDVIGDASRDEQMFATYGIAERLVKLVYEKNDIAPDVRMQLAHSFLRIFEEDFDIAAARDKIDETMQTLCKHRQPMAYKMPTLVIKTKKIVNRYYNNPNLNIAMIGEKLGVSGYYASKRFKKYTGISLGEYICRVRVERAKRLMLDSNLRLADIARRVGLNDTRALNIIFKRVEGMAPSVSRSISRDN